MASDSQKTMEAVIRNDGRYPVEAYAFLNEALVRAVKDAHGENATGARRHVSGQQVCQAARELAVERWGLLARLVLCKWNIRGTIDLGNMVYLMVDHGFMRKTDEDSIEHFRDVYDFGETFDEAHEFRIN